MLYSTRSQKQLTETAKSTKQDVAFQIHIKISQEMRIVVFAVNCIYFTNKPWQLFWQPSVITVAKVQGYLR